MNKKGKIFERILEGIIVLVVLVIAAVTCVAFSFRKENVGENYRKADPNPQKLVNMSHGKENSVDAYTDIGQIRANTKLESDDNSTAVIVVTPWFAYPAGDGVLYEELAQKELQIKSLIINYFSQHSMFDLREKGENEIKEELLTIINEQLVMGRIRAVYFNDYIFID